MRARVCACDTAEWKSRHQEEEESPIASLRISECGARETIPSAVLGDRKTRLGLLIGANDLGLSCVVIIVSRSPPKQTLEVCSCFGEG